MTVICIKAKSCSPYLRPVTGFTHTWGQFLLATMGISSFQIQGPTSAACYMPCCCCLSQSLLLWVDPLHDLVTIHVSPFWCIGLAFWLSLMACQPHNSLITESNCSLLPSILVVLFKLPVFINPFCLHTGELPLIRTFLSTLFVPAFSVGD